MFRQVYHPHPELKLHDVVEVFGVLSLDPELASLHLDAMNLDAVKPSAEFLANHPPSSLVSHFLTGLSLSTSQFPSDALRQSPFISHFSSLTALGFF